MKTLLKVLIAATAIPIGIIIMAAGVPAVFLMWLYCVVDGDDEQDSDSSPLSLRVTTQTVTKGEDGDTKDVTISLLHDDEDDDE